MVLIIDKTSFKLRRKECDITLPLILSKIVYKPLALKNIVPTLVRHTEHLPESDLELWLPWDLRET